MYLLVGILRHRRAPRRRLFDRWLAEGVPGMRVMTYNIRTGGREPSGVDRLDAVIEVASAQRPDVLALQARWYRVRRDAAGLRNGDRGGRRAGPAVPGGARGLRADGVGPLPARR
jgi:hypothetical protein